MGELKTAVYDHISASVGSNDVLFQSVNAPLVGAFGVLKGNRELDCHIFVNITNIA
jgi:hypothetical protein